MKYLTLLKEFKLIRYTCIYIYFIDKNILYYVLIVFSYLYQITFLEHNFCLVFTNLILKKYQTYYD